MSESVGGSVLVTGATGFVGSHLCRHLDACGWDVAAMRRPDSDTRRLDGVDVDWEVADVTDAGAVRRAVAGHDRVFHLAGRGLLSADAETVTAVNVEGTRAVLDAARATGVARVVFVGTAGTRRSASGPADETDRAPPVGAYQASKARAERLVAEAVDDGLDAVTALPTSVFGPGDRTFTARLLSLVTAPAMVAYLPGGASIVGVDDVAAGLAAAMTDGRTGEAYILGGQNLTYGAALAVLARAADGRAPPIRLPAPCVHAMGAVAELLDRAVGVRVFPGNRRMGRLLTNRLFYRSAKAERELGYEASPLAAHADAAVEWYRGRGA